jgi:glycogen phosphorylase
MAQDVARDAVEDLRRDILRQLTCDVGVSLEDATPRHWLHATALALRGRLIGDWHETNRKVVRGGLKQVCYLSMEFLMARQLENALMATGLQEQCRQALAAFGVDLDEVIALEPDPALGNGGLGRLAACFLDSMAYLGIPGIGYGIRYEYGMFRQELADGWQVEKPEDWLADSNPWEFHRSEATYRVQFGGRVEHRHHRAHWEGTEDVLAVAHDVLVPAHNGGAVNTLRLWGAKPADALDISTFNRGYFIEALAPRMRSETITRLLYPDDSTPEGRQLRLRQEHFFVSASLQDVIARFRKRHNDWFLLPTQFAFHLNDTHPALAPAELMRLLVDVHQVSWEDAWRITSSMFSYTNHTLLPEALEVWPEELMRRNVPRHLELITEINRRFLADLRGGRQKAPNEEKVAVLTEGGSSGVNMGRLSVLVSRRVNGVSALHSQLVREVLFPDFAELFPERFENVTNGINHRLWLYQSNPGLAQLIDEKLGRAWRDKLQLTPLARFAADRAFRDSVREVKLQNKRKLARLIAERTGTEVDPSSMFDVQVKRIHEYKRQLLNVLGVVARWNAMKRNPHERWPPRVVILAGKAAAGYWFAKLIIKLANDVAGRINADPQTADRLKLVFLPNYNVSLAEEIIPAADLSQQISLAGTEASGTGNMKLALNGALTLGTADGANLEIADAVGAGNIFLCGLKVREVAQKKSAGYNPMDVAANNPDLRLALEQIARGEFSPDEPSRFAPIVDALLRQGDRFMVLADFADYLRAQRAVDQAWLDQDEWARKAVLNIAQMGPFSSDRSIERYATHIWQADALPKGALSRSGSAR